MHRWKIADLPEQVTTSANECILLTVGRIIEDIEILKLTHVCVDT